MQTTDTDQTKQTTIRAREVAAMLDIDVATVYKHVQIGTLPSPTPESRPMYWASNAFDSFDKESFKKQYRTLPKTPKTRREFNQEQQEQQETIPEVPQAPRVKVIPTTPQHKHYLFGTILHYVSVRRHLYLHGPMGSGKSHVSNQVADVLGLNYDYVSLNPQSPASLLGGFMNVSGQFVSTTFQRAYEFGGVFCIDELDNASASLLTTLNSALANGKASFPKGTVNMHADFILICTGNTTGRGGDWLYPDRRKIDAATLDRLFFLEFDYDLELESELALRINPDCKTWLDWVRSVRAYVANSNNGIREGVYATPRSVFAGASDLANAPKSITLDIIIDGTVFKGLDKDTRRRILNACPLSSIVRGTN